MQHKGTQSARGTELHDASAFGLRVVESVSADDDADAGECMGLDPPEHPFRMYGLAAVA